MSANPPQKEKCPKYKKQSGLELIYNAPTEEDVAKVKQGLAIPGGLNPKHRPTYKWKCSNCGHLWGNTGK